MNQVPRLLIPLLLTAALVAACSGSAAAPAPAPARQPAAQPPTRAPALPSEPATGPASRGTFELSGGAQGFLSVLAVSCQKGGGNVFVAIRGRVERELYGVDITAPRSGDFHLLPGNATQSGSLQLSSQTPADMSVSRWSAGIDAGGAGSLNIADDGGSIDADLSGFGGTRGAVHLRGSWSCA